MLFSTRAAKVLPTARPEPFKVLTKDFFPVSYSLNLIYSSLILFFILSSYFLEFKNILHTNKIFVFFHPLSALIQLFALFYCTVKVALGYDFIWRDRKYKKFKM